MRIDLPAYLPDQSINSGVITIAENVYRSVDGYRPVRDFLTGSDALPNPFNGGAAFISTGGTSYLLAGTTEELVRYSAGGWVDLLTGLTVSQRWAYTQFGDYVVTVNGGATQVVDLNAGTAGALAGAPPGTCITVVGDQVVIGQADGNILLIKWSAFNDHTGWTPGTNQSGFQPMLTGGEVMGLAGGEFGVILQRQRLVRMSRTGDADAPFAFDEITPNVGCASKGSVAQAGRSVFFLSDRGFMACEDGQVPLPIGNEKVDRDFQAQIPRDEWHRIYSAVDPRNTLVWWMLPGVMGKIWIYNWTMQEWSFGTFSCDGMFSGFTSSVDTDNAGITNTDADPALTVDDPRFSGGAPRLFMVQDGEIGTMEGVPLKARIGMGFVEFSKDAVSRIRSFRPVGDMTAAECVLDCRQRLGDAENLVTASPLRASGIMPCRATGKYVKTTMTIPAGTEWGYCRAFEYELSAGGLR
ncbi:hypothetical protein [Sphingopyxis sp. 22461]|uniref:hypothetical protein n=1 Tax=Sphingopyxis sp. 22461 TaxID=3453923 RepID=UPI003F83BE36